MGEWISVEDRLPTFGHWVLVWTTEQICIAECHWEENEVTCVNEITWLFTGEQKAFVTHWMSLPDPPSIVPSEEDGR